MTLTKIATEAQLISNNTLHHMCTRLLCDQGFSEPEAKNIIEVEVYLLSPKDLLDVREQTLKHELSLEQARLLVLKQKQRRYFLILLQQFWEAQAMKYKGQSTPLFF
ncbi:hypothetical protein [Vibrio sp. TBV020]|uniref:hypothetical protein n=1 Tax=Vibrio sp. TBV020 TaxID=3137398 RepID=UPI0038CD82C3